jgi:uncharacterized protein GlcG (DUF336 family)
MLGSDPAEIVGCSYRIHSANIGTMMMTMISLDTAQALINAALEKARALGLKPLCVAVVDAGGHLIALARENGGSTLRPHLALGKACGALALGISSRKIGDMALERPVFIASISAIAVNGIVPAAGGIIIVDQAGAPAGAIGITGDTSDNDEICALAAISAVGLTFLP